jgi:cytochrome c
MGHRNPYRIAVDQKTGYVYWGDVGPDASKDSTIRGPMGYDEVGQARKAGFFGWPYFIANNRAYVDFDFAADQPGSPYDPQKPINSSPNNTGINELPPAQSAFIWYPYGRSDEFPLVGTGGRTAMAGPVYYYDDYKNTTRAFPDYFDKKLFIYEWMRGWIFTVTMDEEGNYISMERFMPNYKFSNPSDMEFSKESGDLFMLEYGTAWFRQNDDARLVRIEYTKGNRKPIVQVAADKTKGAIPLAVNFSSSGTLDYDHDDLKYEWSVIAEDGTSVAKFSEENPSFTFDKSGQYKVVLTATDAKGEKSAAQVDVFAGNEPPQLSFKLTNGNSTFFFPGRSLSYDVYVTDKEDGSIGNGIDPDQVSVNIDYLKEGFDKTEIAQGHKTADALAGLSTGNKLMAESDCKSCHLVDKKSIGPTFVEVSQKYEGDSKAVDFLADKIINGGGGIWGEVAMAAHPQLSKEDAREMVKYILSLGKQKNAALPPKGSFKPDVPKGDNKGVYILRASYTDRGANGLPPAFAEHVTVLRNPVVAANQADNSSDIMRYTLPETDIELMIGSKDAAFVSFNDIDLTGISSISFVASAAANYGQAGGVMEVHVGSPTGEIIGTTDFVKALDVDASRPGMPGMVTAKIQPTEGKKDLYFVYRNDKAASGQSLFTLINIIFQ